MTNQVLNKKSKFRFIWIIPILLLIATAIPKIIGLDFMDENMTNIGLGHMIFSVGIIEFLCAIVFLIPQSRKIGFFLCVAYIGGIITAQWTSNSFNLGVIMQVLLWVGMYFEDKELFQLKKSV